MPANLSPEYKAAADAYRKARAPEQKLEFLREMLRVIPKHKGTDHLQADLKRRIRELSEEIEAPQKGGVRTGPTLVVRPEGAAQVALIGPPNSGKSSLHASLTHSSARVAPYPFTTQYPEPGMLPIEDVQLQLVDLPPVSRGHPLPWFSTALQTADACLLVLDLTDLDDLQEVADIHAILGERGVSLSPHWGATPDAAPPPGEDPFALCLPTLLVGTKADLVADPAGELAALDEMIEPRYPAVAVSTATGAGLDQLGPWLFRELGIVRVYTKVPGKPADLHRPFSLRRGDTVADVARMVHRDLEHTLRFARVWDASGHGGQHVGRDHVVADRDVVELHV
jgi:hypothetical protein